MESLDQHLLASKPAPIGSQLRDYRVIAVKAMFAIVFILILVDFGPAASRGIAAVSLALAEASLDLGQICIAILRTLAL